MASKTRVTVTHDKEATVDLKNQYQATSDKLGIQCVQIENLVRGLSSGARNGTLSVTIDDGNEAQASGTVTCASTVATNTVTVAGVVFTAVASGATGNQFNIGGSDTITAANIAAAINGSVSAAIAGVVSASSAAAVVTLKSVSAGPVGNLITLASSGATVAVSGATLTGGSAATNVATVSYSK